MKESTKTISNQKDILSPELLKNIHAYWRAANYLSVGQLYLRDNPLLKESLKLVRPGPSIKFSRKSIEDNSVNPSKAAKPSSLI